MEVVGEGGSGGEEGDPLMLSPPVTAILCSPVGAGTTRRGSRLAEEVGALRVQGRKAGDV